MKKAYKYRIYPTKNQAQQSAQLPDIKALRPEYEAIYSQVLQDVLHRVDKAFQAFFHRVKAGQQPGHPRFKSRLRYDSLTYPQSGFGIDEQVGLDVGLKVFAYLSTGEHIDNPRFFRQEEKALPKHNGTSPKQPGAALSGRNGARWWHVFMSASEGLARTSSSRGPMAWSTASG